MRTMMRLLIAILASVVLLSVPAASLAVRAQSDRGLELLRQGIELVEEGDFERAVVVLEAAAADLESGRGAPSDVAMSYFYAGVAHVLMSGDDEAMSAFRRAQQQDPGFSPAPAEFPRRILQLWESVESTGVGSRAAAADSPSAALGAGSSATLEDGAGRGGGWWRWAALAGGGGGAVAGYLALDENQPPVADFTVLPSGSGMAGLTSYRFDAGGSSDPDNDGLTYSWNFGDGGSGSGVNSAHVYDAPGNYSVALTVSDGKEQATSTGTVGVARNLDGGKFVSDIRSVTYQGVHFSYRETISLTQTGSSLSGSASFSGEITGATPTPLSVAVPSIAGSIESVRDFVCPCDVGLVGPNGYQFSGTVDNDANILRGDRSYALGGAIVTSRDVTYRRQ